MSDAREPLVFLSHAGQDVDQARELARHLRGAALRVWLEVEELRPGDSWMEAIERALLEADAFAIYVGSLGVQRWVDRELRIALTRSVNDPKFRIIPVLANGADAYRLPPFLNHYQAIGLKGASGFQDVAARVREVLGPAPAGYPRSQQAPFRGLERFDAADSIFFFGRDRAVEELLQRMRGAPLITVVGASGVGKSSLVRAGLLPALFRGRYKVAGGAASPWRAAVFRPGNNVLRELASALPQLKPEASDAERVELHVSSLRQLEASSDLYGLLSVLTPEGSHCALVIDQFEELMTLNSAALQQSFVSMVTAALEARGDRTLHMILTMRADFLSECWKVPGLVSLIDRGTCLAPPMNAGELRSAIAGPLELIGGRIEAGLTDRILFDLGTDPGRLPLMEHALLQLWRLTGNGTLSHQDYDRIGGITGALTNRAEEIYMNLPEADRHLARAVFLRMVRAAPHMRPTRRRVSRDEIERLIGEPAVTERVLGELIASRLVVGDADSDTQVVEVVHETLLDNWPRYAGWIQQEIASLRIEEELRLAVEQWQGSGKDAAYLFTGSRLIAARAWAEEHRSITSAELREFLEQSASEFESIQRLKKDWSALTGFGARIQADALEWLAFGSDPEYLYRPAKLARARDWARANPDQITPEMEAFLGSSEEYNRRGQITAPDPQRFEEIYIRDLQQMMQIQNAIIGPLPTLEAFAFARYSSAARYVSGDLAAVRVRDDGTVAFWLADASGKGAAAALYMAALHALFLSCEELWHSPSKVLEWVNSRLYEMHDESRYVTCVFGFLDPASRRVRCANAGAVQPFLASPGTDRQQLSVEGVPLGLLPDREYEIVDFTLDPGGRLLLVSDGVTEALNPDEEEFGTGRIAEMLTRSQELTARDLMERMGESLEAFSGGRGLFDDTTLLLLQADRAK